MNQTYQDQPQTENATEHFDVLVVGAGISGIGAGYHLMDKCPDRTYAILEGRENIGGTWDLFKYPGIRSDSDMHTLGYAFKPWTNPKAIADGPSILTYLNETAREFGIDRHIRFGHYVKSASWSSVEAKWTVSVELRSTGQEVTYTCNFLFMCSGYYNYKEGYTPDWNGLNDYKGQLIHPQAWPEDLDYKDKKMIVIGSGATAVTIVPEVAKDANHVTMLQRSPTYMVSRPGEDGMANFLRKFLPEIIASTIVRWRNILLGAYFFRMCRTKPERVKKMLLDGVTAALPEGYDIETHFTPSYNPWDQRLCLVPDGDFFEAIKFNKASVITGIIETFTAGGVKLTSGEYLEADIIVTATGLNMQLMSGMPITVDGELVNPGDCLSYKGMMYSDIPNLATSFGYTNASWTLKCDLTCKYVCKLMNYMSENGFEQCLPKRPTDEEATEPFIDFSSGYVQRAMEKFPSQGKAEPWKVYQNYLKDKVILGFSKVDDGVMKFSVPDSSSNREQKPLTEDAKPVASTN